MIKLIQLSHSVFILRLLYTMILGLLPYCLYAQEEEATDPDLTFSIYFKINSSEIAPSYLSNKVTLENIDKVMNATGSNLTVSIEAFSSPDGQESANNALAAKRAESIKHYFLQKYGNTGRYTIETASRGEDWSDLLESVVADQQIPGQQALIRLLKDQSLSRMQRKEKIRELNGGKTYAYLSSHQFLKLRVALIHIRSHATVAQHATTQQKNTIPPPCSENREDSILMITDIAVSPPYPERSVPISSPKTSCSIKTNMAAYAFGVANVGIEIPLGERFSIDLPLYYSPYTLGNAYRFRILATQPELRYWFDRALKGHFMGLYGTGGWYNISYNNAVRYQDRDGNTPAWGGGLSYGYSLGISRRWNVEFTGGVGYLRLVYDKFYNTKNGAKFGTQSKSYYGLTKLGITLSYTIIK